MPALQLKVQGRAQADGDSDVVNDLLLSALLLHAHLYK